MNNDEEPLPGNTRKQKLLGIDLPGNSDVIKREKSKIEDRLTNKKKVTGRIVKKKVSLGTRFAETFLAGDAQNVGEYVVRDVLIPALKSTISDMLLGGIEMLMYGDRQSNRRSSHGNKKMISYSNFYQNEAKASSPRQSNRGPRRGKLDDLYVDSRRDADITLETLDNILEEFGVVTVADLMETLILDSDYTDNKYGWKNLAKASVQRTPDGYKINMPRPESLD